VCVVTRYLVNGHASQAKQSLPCGEKKKLSKVIIISLVCSPYKGTVEKKRTTPAAEDEVSSPQEMNTIDKKKRKKKKKRLRRKRQCRRRKK